MYLVVLRRAGPEWDPSKPMEEQTGWDDHAAFMDKLVEDGFLLLGGPLEDGVRTAHAMDAESPDQIRELFARDPWSRSHLLVDSIDEWEIRLGGTTPGKLSSQ